MTSIAKQLLNIVAITLYASFSYWVRFDSFTLSSAYTPILLIFVIFTHLSLSWTGHYRQQPALSSKSKIERIVSGIFLSALLTTMFLYFTKTGADFSRLWFGYLIVGSIIIIYTIEFSLEKIIESTSRVNNILILGKNKTAIELQNEFAKKVRGIVAIQIITEHKNLEARTLLQQIDQAAELVEKSRLGKTGEGAISEIWITHDIYSRTKSFELENKFLNSPVKLVYVAELPTVNYTDIDIIRGFATVNSGTGSSNRFRLFVKDLLDKLVAIIIIIVLFPMLILIGLLIKLNSKGSVFYEQSRFGSNGAEFKIYKFRTMKVAETTQDFKQATKHDPRVTGFGKFLRRTSLDELPQLYNVLKGDMSLVGPRPHPNLLDQKYSRQLDRYMQRYHVKPGITGLAQIRGFRGETKNNIDMENRILSDLEYVKTWSILLDVKILIFTAWHILTTTNAH